jgi:phospholipid/cholesterol/gamma-HCH transport system substrate-binding protein
MHLSRRIRIQLGIFAIVSAVAVLILAFGYIHLPNLIFGAGHYTVTMQLPASGGLAEGGIVTYRGVDVGRVQHVDLTDSGAEAVLSLQSGMQIPSDLKAEVHSRSAIGEQYVALLPRDGNARPLHQGDVIAQKDTSIPPNINALLNAANTALVAIPHDNLKTVVDESYNAVGGLGPEMARLVKGGAALAIGARQDLDALTTIIDDAAPTLDAQTATADAVSAWASNLAAVTTQLQHSDSSLAGVLEKAPLAADEARSLIGRLQPTLPILLANLVSLGDVALTYQANIEQLLVLIPQSVAMTQGQIVPNIGVNSPYNGAHANFDLNLNLPKPCTTGYLPPTQMRTPVDEDYPDRPEGDLYCRVPQDSPFNVRGARNFPCETVPGKRAPTVKMCESQEQYVPLNDGYNWKGDPNATLSGQAVPQPPPGTPGSTAPPAPNPAPIAAAQYDPATGTYLGPDGKVYTQSNLAHGAEHQTWQSMLIPAPGN